METRPAVFESHANAEPVEFLDRAQALRPCGGGEFDQLTRRSPAGRPQAILQLGLLFDS